MACCCGGCPCLTFSDITFCCFPSFINQPTSGGTGACCDHGSCVDGVTQADCNSTGGVYRGDGSLCASSPCGTLKLFEDSNSENINGQVCMYPGVSGCNDCFTGIHYMQLHSYPSDGCTGTPIDFFLQLSVYYAVIDGINYVLVRSETGDDSILFYGSSAGTSIANEVVCNQLDAYDNPLFDCIGLGPRNLIGIAGGGTVDIGAPCPIGACCIAFGSDCTQLCEADCIDCTAFGLCGTYVGDGVPCDPFPC